MRHWLTDRLGRITNLPATSEVDKDTHEARHRDLLIGGLKHPSGGNWNPQTLEKMSTAQLARMVRARQDSKELRERVSKLSPHFDLSETEKIAQAEYDALVKQAALGKEAEKIEQDEAFKELEERFGQ